MTTLITGTGKDVRAAILKRLTGNGYFLTDNQLDTLSIDVMDVVNTDSANAISHATNELASNPKRKFVLGI